MSTRLSLIIKDFNRIINIILGKRLVSRENERFVQELFASVYLVQIVKGEFNNRDIIKGQFLNKGNDINKEFKYILIKYYKYSHEYKSIAIKYF